MDWRKTLSLAIIVATLACPVGVASDDAISAPQTGAAENLVRLQDLVREALDRNPEIQAARRVVEAKQARIPQSRAWPDPRVSVSYGGNLLPPFTLMNGDPSSTRQFMAEQEIPFPGKTRLRGEIASREADAELLAYETTWRRVAAEVKQAFFDLYFTDQSLSILLKDRELLEKFEKIAEIRYSVGKAAQQDVLKAQVEISGLAERETLLEQTRRTLEAQLNSLRDLPVDTPVGPTAEGQTSAFAYSLEELEAAALANFPALNRQRKLVEENRLSVRLAEKEVKPDFSVGYAYMQRAGMGDMYGITLTTSLPIFRRNKQGQAIKEAAANLKSSQQMEANELTLLRYRVKQEFLRVQAADRLLKLYAQGILPQSTLALESSLASYETGAIDFLNVLSNFTTVLDYELGYQEQLASHEKALARLEELTSLELVR